MLVFLNKRRNCFWGNNKCLKRKIAGNTNVGRCSSRLPMNNRNVMCFSPPIIYSSVEEIYLGAIITSEHLAWIIEEKFET